MRIVPILDQSPGLRAAAQPGVIPLANALHPGARMGCDSHSPTVAVVGVALLVALMALVAQAGQAAAPRPEQRALVQFNRDIRPILSENCFTCHGPDTTSGWPICGWTCASGDRCGAPLCRASRSRARWSRGSSRRTESRRMPPAFSHKQLTLGAEGPAAALGRAGREVRAALGVRAAARTVVDPAQSRMPPGAAIRSTGSCWRGSSARGCGLRRTASRADWLRRVTLDLTGLPPTPREADAFLADRSPHAYEKVVDRLLASPRYGERMALPWLDVARYADSYGYQSDQLCPTWPYRDWVVKAFNDNLPYDQFITWQLAGDLLPNATREQRLATAFNRLHRMTNEGGSVPEEWRIEGVADRVPRSAPRFSA